MYGPDLDRAQRDAARAPVEALQWRVAQRVLRLGGSWAPAERAASRRQAAALGAAVETVVLDVPLAALRARIAGRDESREGTLQITRAELAAWAERFEAPTDDELRQP